MGLPSCVMEKNGLGLWMLLKNMNEVSCCVCNLQERIAQTCALVQNSRISSYLLILISLCRAWSGAAIPDIKRQFLLEPAKNYEYLRQSGCYELEGVDDVKMFEETKLAFNVLNISPEMSDGIFCVLSAILLVGNLEFKVRK